MERIIISLTTWRPRIHNIPVVLDSILAQSVKPDKIVINLAYEESLPEEIQEYVNEHNIELNYVEDTKVYKKVLPTLQRYPEDCIINIDDDFIYPSYMIEDFIKTHNKYPSYPISGNRIVLYGKQCHCGCASLVKKEYFGDFLNDIDSDLMKHCLSDDLVFTYLAILSGHPYLRTKKVYFLNMKAIESPSPYSSFDVKQVLNDTRNYMVKRFGKDPSVLSILSRDKKVMRDWNQMALIYEIKLYQKETMRDEDVVINSPLFIVWKKAYYVWNIFKQYTKSKH